jgi:CRP/FNR family transcriptional regulator, anaerobic regulatory protein
MENSMVTSYKSFITQQPAEIAFEALENTELILIPRAGVYDLYDKFKTFDKLGRIMAERSFVEIQNLRKQEFSLTPEEKYLRVLKEEPKLIDRVSQHYISSYLGMTPEHLSRIRKKISKRSI